MFEKKVAEGLDQGLAKLTLEQRILYINERFNRAALLSKFSWADQYLTWLFITRDSHISLYANIVQNQSEQAILRQITSERYEISFNELDEDVIQTLKKYDAWITSAHKSEEAGSSNQQSTPSFAVWREELGVIEINPFADFTPDDIELAVLRHEIPVNLAAIELSSQARGQDEQDALIVTSNNDRPVDITVIS